MKFIENNKSEYPIKILCKIIGLSRCDYYYYQNYEGNSYHKANEKLDKEIKEEYEKSKGRYGSPKIQKMLEKRGIKASQKRVARRMKKMGMRSITVKKYKPSGSKGKVDDKDKSNLLEQNFKAEGLREKLVSDITYIYTKEKGWTYLAIVMDLYSLSIIGYSYGETMDAELVIKAIKNARAKGKFKKGAIFHSDLGSQYTSNKVEKYLKELELEHSYSKKGYPYDNASMESFNAILKKEEVNLHVYKTFEEARRTIFEFIESWYNRRRIHSSIGYKVPNELENEVA